MTLTRRAALALPLFAPALARAETYPDRAIRWVCPYAPGGNSDIVSRILAPAMADVLGQPVVIENRAGAGGSVGALAVARLRPDGYTILLGSNGPLSVNPAIQANLGYDPLKDFTPIGLACRTPQTFVVKNALPVHTLAEFMDYARSRPGAVSVGSSGVGSTAHLALETFNARTGLELQHIPFGSGGAMAPNLIAGNIDAAITEISTSLPLARGGQARILAIASARRSVLAPEIPTVAEAGVPDYREAAYLGPVLPPGAAPALVAVLSRALLQALAKPETQRRLNESGSEVAELAEQTPEGFAAFLAAETARARTAAARAGLRPA